MELGDLVQSAILSVLSDRPSICEKQGKKWGAT